MAGLNLDAIIGELEPRPLTYKQVTIDLPGELPTACLAPFLKPELGLIPLVASIFEDDDSETEGESWIETILAHLKAMPTLPLDVIAAAKESLDALLGENKDAFYALNPSLNAYWALASNLGQLYGLDYFAFFTSDESSLTAGESSKETSSESTGSTPETSSEPPETPASSGSGDS